MTTDEDGRFVVPYDPAGPDGEHTLTFTGPASSGGDEQEPVTFVAGDAVLGLTPAAGTASAGGAITYTGALTVEGRPLPGRAIDLGSAAWLPTDLKHRRSGFGYRDGDPQSER